MKNAKAGLLVLKNKIPITPKQVEIFRIGNFINHIVNFLFKGNEDEFLKWLHYEKGGNLIQKIIKKEELTFFDIFKNYKFRLIKINAVEILKIRNIQKQNLGHKFLPLLNILKTIEDLKGDAFLREVKRQQEKIKKKSWKNHI